MAEWWAGLTTLQQVLYYVAIPFTIVLLIQAVMTIIGMSGGSDADGDGDADMDADGDMDGDFDAESDFDAEGDMDAALDADAEFESDVGEPNAAIAGFRFFTVRGIVAFFCMFGWSGAALHDTPLPVWAIILIAVAIGFFAMFVIGLMFYAVRRLQSSGNIRYRNAVGKTAEVYIPIPAERAGKGKVMVLVQERLTEAEAMTDEKEKIGTGETVKIIGNIGATLIVKR